MTVDKYAICPCGSGKKIKFCKCKESVSELDRVSKMIEGGQLVPALDHLSKVLQEHPDAAWALAIRGRLLLDLREYDSLAENADRFIRLQPSNPLALTQRAAARIFKNDVAGATESLLAALTESGREIDSFVLDMCSVLAYSLAQRGVVLTSRQYAVLPLMANYEGGQSGLQILQQMNTSATVNQLLKSDIQPIDRPADADWGERYDEAIALLRSYKIEPAESKFHSLQRSVPNEPSVLVGLLACAIWRGHSETQQDLLKKLSQCDSLDFEKRARLLALSALVEPAQSQISGKGVRLEVELDNLEEVEMALLSHSRFAAIPQEMINRFNPQTEEVPPRQMIQILDREKPESLDQLPPIDQLPQTLGLAVVFGRQTDRSARIEIADVAERDLDAALDALREVVPDLEWESNKTEHDVPLLIAARPTPAMLPYKVTGPEANRVNRELALRETPQTLASLKVDLLDGSSLKELAGNDEKLLQRTAFLRIIENYDEIVSKGDDLLKQIYELADLEPLPPLKVESNQVDDIDNEDLNRIDVSNLDGEALIYLIRRCEQVSSTPALRRAADRLQQVELPDDQKPARIAAYMAQINAAYDDSEALEILEKAKVFASEHGISNAPLLLSEVGLRITTGDSDGFRNAVDAISREHGNDPEVMARLQQTLMAYGLIRPDGSMPGAPGGPAGPAPAGPAAAEPEAGKLWTPDGGGSANPSGQGGGGKLWVPGMD